MPDPHSTEEEAEQKTEEEPEQDTAAVQALREQLSSDIPLLLGQLTRVKQHCETRGAQLIEKCASIDRILSRLTALKGRIPRLTLKELSEARVDLRLATSCYRDVTDFLSPDRFGQRWLRLYLVLSTVFFGILLSIAWAMPLLPAVAGDQGRPAILTLLAGNAALRAVLFCFCAAGLGGVTAAIRDFTYFSGKGLFDPAWVLSYRLRPLLGAIMGVVAWALLRGGLVVATGPTGTDEPLRESNALYFAVAFIAGFAVEQVARKLYDIAETVFAVSERRGTQR